MDNGSVISYYIAYIQLNSYGCIMMRRYRFWIFIGCEIVICDWCYYLSFEQPNFWETGDCRSLSVTFFAGRCFAQFAEQALAVVVNIKIMPGCQQNLHPRKDEKTQNRCDVMQELQNIMTQWTIHNYMGVSKNRGTQIINFNRVFHYKPSILGFPPIFGNTHMRLNEICLPAGFVVPMQRWSMKIWQGKKLQMAEAMDFDIRNRWFSKVSQKQLHEKSTLKFTIIM